MKERVTTMLLKTPMVVSNRCAFMAIYNFDLPNGGFVSMSTSKGMKAIDQANVQLQGKNMLSAQYNNQPSNTQS